MKETVKGHALINSIIGEGTFIRGDIELHGLLRIDGDFEGSIKTDGRVLMGKSGRAKCHIAANTVVLGGVLKGNVHADFKVVLLSTCMVIGNIVSPHIVIEEGVIFHGHCTVSEDAKVLTAVPAANGKQFSIDWGGRDNQSSPYGRG
ncbi:MAG: hypothetical protein B0D92_01875 [Spirochaeta sp. LUC14_002_19_P3]|nr:MAG: hypothetical protein B0D92_01875 [Spirochaeta sp. LUC14_002_19_P3]